jgi:SAM-dependent methyltransferase
MVRFSRAAYVDLRLFITGKSDPDLPPLRLRDVGLGDFRVIGQHLFNLTVTYGVINADSRLVDVGCGAGRLALPLSRYIVKGKYEGFDVSAGAIRWCRRNITPRHPNFRFTFVALKNPHYSSRGGTAAQFEFPYADSCFDCVVAYSVFTHLDFNEIANYVRQTYRVLAPGGRFVALFFLMNAASEQAQKMMPPHIQQFPHENGPVRLADKSNPAFAVAVSEQAIVGLLREAGFREIIVKQGSWYGAQNSPTFQDLVVSTK